MAALIAALHVPVLAGSDVVSKLSPARSATPFCLAPRCVPSTSTLTRQPLQYKRSIPCSAANPEGQGHTSDSFDIANNVEARVESVRKTDRYGHVVFLRLLEQTSRNLLPVYIGDFECSALVSEINKIHTQRPMTHDLAVESLRLLGFRVTKVVVTALVGRTYHARIYFAASPNGPSPQLMGSSPSVQGEVSVDARPSDAINYALRFGAAIYVNREVAAKMAQAPEAQLSSETVSEIERSCREDAAHYPDPTLSLQLALQLAIAEERYGDASQLRNQIDNVLARDRALSLVVAMETALDDKRFEEAQRLRDELRQLMSSRFSAPQKQKQDA